MIWSTRMLQWIERRLPFRRCNFCHRPYDQVQHLVSGLDAVICDDCLVRCMVHMDGVVLNSTRLLTEILITRGAELSTQQRSGLARAVAALADGGLPLYDAIDSLVIHNDARGVIELLEGTEQGLWRTRDWLNFSWAAASLGDFASAQELEAALPGNLFEDPDDHHLMRNNLIWAHCHCDPLPTEDTLKGFVTELELAREHWEEREADPIYSALASKHRSHLEGTAAKCWSLLGQPDMAIACLEAAEATPAGIQPLATLLWGDLLAAGGNQAGAQAKWRAAKATPSPSEHLKKQLAARLPSLPYRGRSPGAG